jgi:hypothetical protein
MAQPNYLSPWIIGQTHPIWALTFQDDTGAVIDITGTTLSGRIAPQLFATDIGPGVALKNLPTVVNGPTGRFNYAVAVNEVASPGMYVIQFIATYTDGTVAYNDPIPVQFTSAV